MNKDFEQDLRAFVDFVHQQGYDGSGERFKSVALILLTPELTIATALDPTEVDHIMLLACKFDKQHDTGVTEFLQGFSCDKGGFDAGYVIFTEDDGNESGRMTITEYLDFMRQNLSLEVGNYSVSLHDAREARLTGRPIKVQ